MKRVNSTQVAKLAGVAQSTVSLVANNSPRVLPETRVRVIEAARRLGYPLGPRRCPVTGIVMSIHEQLNSYQAMSLTALKAAVNRRGGRMEIICSEDISAVNDRVISGAVAIGCDAALNERWAETVNVPLVRLSLPGSTRCGIPSVYSDEYAAAGLAVAHFNSCGHSRIGLLIRWAEDAEMLRQERIDAGFCRALAESGELFPERFVSYGGSGTLRGRLERLLSAGVTALLVSPGDVALTVCAELHAMGLSVPKDISLIAREFGGVSEFWNPPLTSICPDYGRLAGEALDLLEKLAGRKAELRDVGVPGTLIVRASVRGLGPA